MTQHLRVFATLVEKQVWYLAPIWWLTLSLIQVLRTMTLSDLHSTHLDTYIQASRNTDMLKKKITDQNESKDHKCTINVFYLFTVAHQRLNPVQ